VTAKLARSQRTHAREPGDPGALLKVGDLLAGKYRVERILGEGGMGVVVAAHHELLDQHVAVKLLYQDIADREAQSRLLLEARAAAKLQSEHVARVVDVDTGADGLPFIVMELLEGADLCQVADARGALPRWLVVDYVLQALEGLAHAHARAIIHRDLKPSNLFLANKPDGTQIIKILDFGISKSMEPTESSGERRRAMQLTGGRAVLGSPPYMSPEQVRSPKTVDHRTDIWSLGVVMYELLTNSMPFGGDEVQETFAQILEKRPQPIRALVTGVPEGLERVVMRCLAKNRDERFTDVAELARALVPYGSGTWMHSADRVAATLARGAEEAASGARVKGHTTGLERTAIPSSPGRRTDSMQPELHGTASTVARRFTVFEKKRTKTMLAVAAVVATTGLVLIAGTAYQRSRAPVADETTAAAVPVPPAPEASAIPLVGNGTGIVTAPVHTAAPESEMAPNLAPGTLIGASTPAPPATPTAVAVASAPKKAMPLAAPPAARTSAPALTSAKKAPPPAAAPPKPALPPGLPRDRQ